MSAFVVSKEHVDALVWLGLRGPSGGLGASQHVYGPRWLKEEVEDWRDREYLRLGFDNLNEVGDMLVRECVRSVSYRYQDNEDLPGPVEPYWMAEYRHERPFRIPSAVEGLKLLDCFEYQSCEHPEWEASEAHRFCEALRSSLIEVLPGYEDAPWEFTRPREVA